MSSNWVPPGSSGQGPPPGENTQPSELRGVEPGQRGQNSGFDTNLKNMRESITVVGKLSAAMSSFYTKLGGDGKRKVTEFSGLIKTLNSDLEETSRRLKEVAEESAKVGAGGGGQSLPGYLDTIGAGSSGGSYTQNQLPTAPTVASTVGRGGGGALTPDDVAPTGGPAVAAGVLGTGISPVKLGLGVAAAGATATGRWFNQMAEPVAAMNMQEHRFALDPNRTRREQRETHRGFFDRRDFQSYDELLGTQSTLEQQGIRLGGADFDMLTASSGAMRQVMPHHSTEALAGAGAGMRHGNVGRDLRMKGIINWDMPTEDVFRQLAKHPMRNKEMPPLDVLQKAQPGHPYYEVLLALTGDPNTVRMVIDFAIAEIASIESTGQGLTSENLTAEHASAMGLGDNTVEGAERDRAAQATLNLSDRQETVADELIRMHGRAEKVTYWFGELEKILPGLTETLVMMGGYSSSFGQAMASAGGSILGQIGGTVAALKLAGVGGAGAATGAAGAGLGAKLGALGAGLGGTKLGMGATMAAGGAAAAAVPVAVGATAAGGVWAGVKVGNRVGEKEMQRLWEDYLAQGGDPNNIEEFRLFHHENTNALQRVGMGQIYTSPEEFAERKIQERLTEPAGGPPIGGVTPLGDVIEGADHTGSGYSTKGFGGVRSHVAQAGHYINKMFGPMPGGIGGVGQRANASDHPKGLALDFMTNKNKSLGQRISNFMVRNAKHFGVKYVIWDRRINSIDGRGWRRMEDRGNPTANHEDHPHVSFHDAPGSGSGGVADADFAEEEMGDQAGGFSGELPGAASTMDSTSGGYFSTEEADIWGAAGGGAASGGTGGFSDSTGQSDGNFDTGPAGGPRPSVSRGQRLSDPELMAVLRHVGFSGQGLITAFAVAKAESGGYAGAHNPNAKTGDNSYGLFQINMLGTMGPARRQQYGLRSNEDLFDPIKNSEIAYDMSSRGTKWGHWSVHPASKGRGAKGTGYEQHLDTARKLAGGGGGAVEPRGGLSTVGHLSEGKPSGGSMGAAMGGVAVRPASSTLRQVNVNMQVHFEKATRKEARELFKMVQEMARKESGIEMVGSR